MTTSVIQHGSQWAVQLHPAPGELPGKVIVATEQEAQRLARHMTENYTDLITGGFDSDRNQSMSAGSAMNNQDDAR